MLFLLSLDRRGGRERSGRRRSGCYQCSPLAAVEAFAPAPHVFLQQRGAELQELVGAVLEDARMASRS
jgi:hypothetical protein